jgi:membrane-associated phospholipid phosphatase
MTGSHERPLAAEQLLTGYNVVMVLIWAVFIAKAPYAPWLLLAHAAAMALPWLFARVMPTAGRPLRFLRELNPLLFLAVFWLELDLVRPVLGLTGIDGPVAALDRLMAGGAHLHQVWLPAMHGRWFSETMYGLYWAYYVAVYVPPIVLALMARHEPVRDMVFRLVLVYLGCYLVFIAFPVDGPHFLEPPYQGPHTAGFFYGLVERAQGFGDSRGCSFPSSHVAAAAMGAMLGWRWLPRWMAVLLWIEAVGVLLSTCYTQHHYAIDSVTGFAWAVGAWYLAGPLGRWVGATRRPPTTQPPRGSVQSAEGRG